jgi:hypothetical protein
LGKLSRLSLNGRGVEFGLFEHGVFQALLNLVMVIQCYADIRWRTDIAINAIFHSIALFEPVQQFQVNMLLHKWFVLKLLTVILCAVYGLAAFDF